MTKSLLFIILVFLAVYPAFPQLEGGYVNKQSVIPGDTLKFYISTTSATVNFVIKRIVNSSTLVTAATYNNITGGVKTTPDSSYYYGCNWPVALSIVIPSAWLPGMYRVDFNTSLGTNSILFMVKPPTPASYSNVLVVVPTNTWQAYNNGGGKSLYDVSSVTRSYKVSFLRPGGNTVSYGLYNFYKQEIPLTSWLNAKAQKFEYASDWDFEKDPTLASKYKIIIFAGHDEYWSALKRKQIVNFLNSGGKVMNLSGNICWWQVRYENNGNTLVCYKDYVPDPLLHVVDSLVTVNWYNYPVYNGENKIFGTTFNYGGYVNDGTTLPASAGYGGYAAFNTQHWVYNNTGLNEGDVFGFNSTIAGYEVDGMKFSWVNGLPVNTFPSQGAPPGYKILGYSPAQRSDTSSGELGFYYTPGGGALFNAPTIDWAQGLVDDTTTQTITNNVLTRFLQNSFPPDIDSWSPFTLQNKTIINQPLTINKRDILVNQADTTVFSISAQHPFGLAISYIWKVNNINQAGNTNTFSFPNTHSTGKNVITAYAISGADTSKITWTSSTIPSSPVLSQPANNSAAVTVPVVFLWNKNSAANKYYIQVALDSLFTNIIDSTSVTDTTIIFNNLNYNSKYYWRVNSANNYASGAYSSVWSFTTQQQINFTVKAVPQAGNPSVTSFGVTNLIIIANVVVPDTTTITYSKSKPDSLTNPAGIDSLYKFYWNAASNNLQFNSGYVAIPLSKLDSTINPLRLTWLKKSGTQWINIGGKIKDTLFISTIPFSSLGTFALASSKTLLKLKVFLEGAFDTTLSSMTDKLDSINILPKMQPYNNAPYLYSGTDSVSVMPSNITDWVLIELRTGIAANTTVLRKALLLNKSGAIVSLNNDDAYLNINAGNYYIVINHRNHLSVMTAAPDTLSSTTGLYDFTIALSKYYGNDARLINGRYCMFAGDSNKDGLITSLDFNLFYPDFTNAATGYLNTDVNLDGMVTSLDYNLFYINFVSAKQSNVPR